jgi:hypothetical protein
MIDHLAYQLALRTKLQTLSLVTTGSISLAATTAGYSRTTGSFLTDGFAVGMEVTATGFSQSDNTAAKTITGVTALTMSCTGCVAEGAAAGRTLTVGLPEVVAWENIPAVPITGRPYITEQYLPGPFARESLGALGRFEARPMYVIGLHGVPNTGLTAIATYADGLLTLFAPGTQITADNGDILRVRSDTGPFRGQLVNNEPGWAFIPVTVPLRVRTTNSI